MPLDKYKYLTYVHPTCIISNFANLGEGCVLGPNAILTGNVTLDNFVYVSYNSVIGHDTKVGKFTTLYPFVEICGHSMLANVVFLESSQLCFPQIIWKIIQNLMPDQF